MNLTEKTSEVKSAIEKNPCEKNPCEELYEIFWWFEAGFISVVEAVELLNLETVGQFWKLYDTERSATVKHLKNCRDRSKDSNHAKILTRNEAEGKIAKVLSD